MSAIVPGSNFGGTTTLRFFVQGKMFGMKMLENVSAWVRPSRVACDHPLPALVVSSIFTRSTYITVWCPRVCGFTGAQTIAAYAQDVHAQPKRNKLE